jgi:hypothetical protein
MARNAPVPGGPSGASPDDVALVYGWACGLTARPDEAEELVIEVLRRARATTPDCLRAASDVTRLRFLTIQSVLRARGTL